MNKVWAWVADKAFRGVAFVAAFFWAFLSGFFKGKDHEKVKQLQAERNAAEKVKRIHDRVMLDADYRERVRREFDQP